MQSKSGVKCPLNKMGPCTHNRELNAPVANTPSPGHAESRSAKRLKGSADRN
jgi:hypothetical protein